MIFFQGGIKMKMKKKSTKVIAALCATSLCVTGGLTVAAADDPEFSWKSQGRIEFNNGTAQSDDDVIFDADDFNTIANNVIAGKQNIKNTLLNHECMEKWCTDKNINLTTDVPSFSDLNSMAKLLGDMECAGDVKVDGESYKAAVAKNEDKPKTTLKDAHYSSVDIDYNSIIDAAVKAQTGEKNPGSDEIDVSGSATKADVLIGKSFMSGNYGNVAQEGTMPEVTYDAMDGYTLRDSNGTKTEGVVTLDNIAITDGDLTADLEITKGYYNVDGKNKITADVETQSKSVTPGTSSQTVKASTGKILEKVTVSGDADLKSENIVKGVEIFGVTGTAENSSSITPSEGTVSDVVYGEFTFSKDAVKTITLGFKPSK